MTHNNELSSYERFQIETYGNILLENGRTATEQDEYNHSRRQQEEWQQWSEHQAQQELFNHEQNY